jgi:hypothetical protein
VIRHEPLDEVIYFRICLKKYKKKPLKKNQKIKTLYFLFELAFVFFVHQRRRWGFIYINNITKHFSNIKDLTYLPQQSLP